jgi:2-amino-4-hydroxy-6-hydroxymethyldihydropteridine diphosphokinase
MPEALISLGSNLGDARANVDKAIALLSSQTDIRLLARSSDYCTLPWGFEDQPSFINACIYVETELAPHALLSRCMESEHTLGRNRTTERRWGPRCIDIDLLSYDDLVLTTPELTLPHPRLFERAFVLVPLAEIVPGRIIAGRRVREAAMQIDASGIERLPAIMTEHQT